jgi:Flp pilus assembly pilin Flp
MNLWKTVGRRLQALHRDEQGADLIEYILIVAAIALPLLGVIIYYRKDIAEWVRGQYEEVKTESGDTTTP